MGRLRVQTGRHKPGRDDPRRKRAAPRARASPLTAHATTSGANGTTKPANAWSSTAARGSLEQTRPQNLPTPRPQAPREDLWRERDDKTCQRPVSTAARGSLAQTRRQNLPTPRPQPPREDRGSTRDDKTCQRLALKRRARTSGANGTTKPANASSSTAAQEPLEQTERQNMQADRPQQPRKDF